MTRLLSLDYTYATSKQALAVILKKLILPACNLHYSCAIEFLQLNAIFGSREQKTNRNSANTTYLQIIVYLRSI